MDDEMIVRESLRDCLADAGIRVALAESSEAALKILEIQPFDLMLIDYRLPGTDGLALISRIRSKKYPLRMVLISAYLNEEIALQALRSGACGSLAKPIDLDKLEDLVQRELFGRKHSPKIISS